MIGPRDVLIADDDRELVHALSVRMRGLGLTVRTAHDALSALNMVQERVPDLMILDVNMPAGNGLCACEMMASDPNSADVPVIILTGRQDEETIRRCWDLLAYYTPKAPDVWSRLEPLICELLHVESPATKYTRRAASSCP
ncbi:MAG: response regulator [Planctomycetota bacterium]